MTKILNGEFIHEESGTEHDTAKKNEIITKYGEQLISDVGSAMDVLFPVISKKENRMENEYLKTNRISILPCLVSVLEDKESFQRLEYLKSPLFNIKKVLYDAGEKSSLSPEKKEKLFAVLDKFVVEEAKLQKNIYFSLGLNRFGGPIQELTESIDKELHKKKEAAKAYTYLMLTEATQ